MGRQDVACPMKLKLALLPSVVVLPPVVLSLQGMQASLPLLVVPSLARALLRRVASVVKNLFFERNPSLLRARRQANREVSRMFLNQEPRWVLRRWRIGCPRRRR